MTSLYKFFLLLFLSSCSLAVTVSPKGCKTSGSWGRPLSQINSFEFKEDILSFSGEEEIILKDLLSRNNIKCKNVEHMELQIKKGFFDAVIGLFPFVGARTLIVTGNLYSNDTKDGGI